ncbi:MAG: hypothetical protein ACLP8S_08765 [Solirubrobacteraceae bacterium]
MSSIAGSRRAPVAAVGGASGSARVRAYFFSDSRRSVQTVLGLIWLLVGGLQFQSFMYGKGFIQMLSGMAAGQPGWVSSSVNWGATTMQSHQAVFNSLAALIQVAIGFGILYKRTTKPAIVVSFAWALCVWWFGEAFGMLFMNMAMPLTGAPGAVLLYALIGAIVWPNERPGGLLGVRGARTAWAAMWLVMAWLWLLAPSSSANAIHNAINAAPSGMSWLSSVQNGFASVTKGNGLVFAIVLSALSAAIGIAVAVNWRAKEFLVVAAVLSLIFWVVGQGFGGIFAGGATDPNAGLLFIVLSYTLYTLVPFQQRLAPATRRDSTGREVAVTA